jgi:superfamily II DNA helicase RecQ
MGELNRFLGSHRVIGVEKHLVTAQGGGPVWVFCVEYLRGPAPEGRGSGGNATPKVDYREVLSPEDFAVFSRLREVRKGLAERDGVPPYSVFTNEQLAVMVRQRVADTAGLEKIDGVGAARLEKYGAAVLEVLRASGGVVKRGPAAGGQP